MPVPPFAQLNVSVNGGGTQTGAVAVSAAQTIQLGATSTTGWLSQIWEIYDYPVGFNPAGAWSLGSDGHTWQNTKLSPDAFLTGSAWGKFMLRLRINANPLRINADGSPNASYIAQFTDEATILHWPSPNLGLEDLSYGETTQRSILGFVGDHKANLRLLDLLAGGGGGGDEGLVVPPPKASAWTTFHFGAGTTLVDSGRQGFPTVFLSDFTTGGAEIIWGSTRPLPASSGQPYTLITAMRPLLVPDNVAGHNSTAGIFISDGTKAITFQYVYVQSAMHMQVQEFDNATTLHAGGLLYDQNFNLGLNARVWLRIQQASGNRTWAFSVDGQNFLTILTHAAATFLTETLLGLMISPINSPGAGVTLESWNPTAP